MSGANGGIFKTVNGGTTWKALFDGQNVLSIGEIAMAPSNPNIIYVGTGEENPRNNASFGDGVYRSNDGGETWTHVGLEDSDRIARIRIDSRNPDIAYACSMGHEWGPSQERGVYKTTDGGKNVGASALHQRADRLLGHRRRSRQLRHRLRGDVELSTIGVVPRLRRQARPHSTSRPTAARPGRSSSTAFRRCSTASASPSPQQARTSSTW